MDSQLRLGRIVLEDTQAKHQDVTIDLVFEGNRVKRGQVYFGMWRDKNEQSICPFVISENGEADFGTGYSGEDRVYQTNILEVELGMGAQVGWRGGDYESTLTIVGITQLV